jgi:hypothetical protein
MGLAKELRNRREVKTREVLVPAWGDESGSATEEAPQLLKQYHCRRYGRFDLYES